MSYSKEHMDKKAQITIFIIIGIVIVGAVISVFAFKNNLKLKFLNPESEKIQVFVESCIEDVGKEVIYEIGQKGGYYFPPNFSTLTGIPYYYANNTNKMPSKKQIEEEISFYASAKLFFCTKNFVDFPNMEIEQGEINVKTIIENDKVVLDVKYPLSIIQEKNTILIQDFKNIEIPVRLGIVYDSIEKIINEQLDYESICLSCILEIVLENDLYVDLLDYDEETVIFIFRDENSKINDETFEFVFANKYDIQEE